MMLGTPSPHSTARRIYFCSARNTQCIERVFSISKSASVDGINVLRGGLSAI
jgi:hypothetical protein